MDEVGTGISEFSRDCDGYGIRKTETVRLSKQTALHWNALETTNELVPEMHLQIDSISELTRQGQLTESSYIHRNGLTSLLLTGSKLVAFSNDLGGGLVVRLQQDQELRQRLVFGLCGSQKCLEKSVRRQTQRRQKDLVATISFFRGVNRIGHQIRRENVTPVVEVVMASFKGLEPSQTGRGRGRGHRQRRNLEFFT
jgi:hypothetical protein